jgi:hypothetical protein
MLYGGGPLGAAARSRAWSYLTKVHPTQQWGISAGVPYGWQVALKNGFYPSGGWGWRLGSTGFVRRTGSSHGYAITVMTDRNSGHYPGMELVEKISRRVSRVLLGGLPATRAVSRSVCTKTVAGESWTTVARRVGVSSDRAYLVRRVSGGNPSPLQGQRGCSPYLAPAGYAG